MTDAAGIPALVDAIRHLCGLEEKRLPTFVAAHGLGTRHRSAVTRLQMSLASPPELDEVGAARVRRHGCPVAPPSAP